MDGVDRNDSSEADGTDGDAAFVEEFAQALDSAVDTLLRGIIGGAEGGADFTEGFVLEVAEQDGGAVGLVERVHGFVEQGFDVRPIGGGGVHGIHLGGDLFAQLAAGLAADDVNGGAAGDLIKPRGEDGIGRKAAGVAGEVGEDGLGDFLGELRGADLAERGGMDEIEVAADDLGEGVFGAVAGIAREQLEVGIAHFQ